MSSVGGQHRAEHPLRAGDLLSLKLELGRKSTGDTGFLAVRRRPHMHSAHPAGSSHSRAPATTTGVRFCG